MVDGPQRTPQAGDAGIGEEETGEDLMFKIYIRRRIWIVRNRQTWVRDLEMKSIGQISYYDETKEC